MTSNKSQTDLLTEISSKLDIMMGYMAAGGMEGDSSAIVERLYKMGLCSRAIAPVAGLSENAVNIRLTRLKKKSTKKSKKKTDEE